ncbi:uncharacterized protein LOC126996088 [Eriocheir sinensis]|uniref:uncharacterized protein LOC126996088 n=1 Tax=Eriocheir sinensis TaxID=95602 RepID=UPI0021C8CF50|nr:uncharacterized protein LOC126996088 [Eriocheir sinensis]
MRTATACLFIVGALLAEAPRWAAGDSLRCYTCSTSENDETCLHDPDGVTSNAPITNCEMEGTVCCMIRRVNYAEDETKLHSFARMCVDNCAKDGFQEYPDPTFITYETICSTPECNVGPGDEPLSGQGPTEAKDNEIWGIKGDRSGAGSLKISFTFLTVLPALLLLLRQQN